MPALMRRLPGRAAVAAIVTGGLLVAGAAPAAASGPVVLSAAYDAAGTSVIKSTHSTITLSRTTLTAGLDAQGSFTGTLPLLPTSSSFKILGLLPVTATVNFQPVGAVTGALTANPNPAVRATAKYYIRLSSVKVAGLPIGVGNSCRTQSPVVISVATPAGQTFDITSGGTVSGTYTIGSFGNCGLTTPLLNLLIPGSGNTVTLTLSNGRIISPT